MPGAEFFNQFFDEWLKNPKGAIAAALLGIVVGFVLSRLRHEGKIDALEERIKHKDEQINLKDDAIQSLTPKPKSKSKRVRTRDSAEPSPEIIDPFIPPSPDAVMFLENQRIVDVITKTQFRFVFNPLTDQSKLLTFNKDGTIGEGCNANEHTWRTMNGSLEIYNDRQQVYSRFLLLPDGETLHHTNQSDTLSIRGQYMVPIAKPPAVSRSVNV